MTKLTGKALRRETGLFVKAHGKMRPLILEVYADHCVLRPKGLSTGHNMDWATIYGEGVEQVTETPQRERLSSADKRQAILTLLDATDSETGAPWSYADIGNQVGFSRQRVRQIAKEELGETGYQRQAQMTAIRVAWRKAHQHRRPLRGILAPQIVRPWLQEIGHSYCGVCYSVKPIGDMTKVSKFHHSTRCKACTAANTQAYHATAAGKAKQAKWQADNPKKLKEYMSRYHQSPKGKARIKARREAAQASA